MENIDINNYHNFWALLKSPDKENSVVALSILNNADFRVSLPYILLLFKDQSKEDRLLWAREAPALFEKLKAMDVIPDSNLSFKKILDLVSKECSTESVQFVIDEFTVLIRRYLIEWGFTFIEDLDFTLKIKDDR
jgi:hypothetical protein